MRISKNTSNQYLSNYLPLEGICEMIGAVLSTFRENVYRKKHQYEINTSFATLVAHNKKLHSTGVTIV